jgi:hypothetical protein
VMFQVEVFWFVTPCSVVVGYQRFRGPCCLHLQGHNPEDLDFFPFCYIFSIRIIKFEIKTVWINEICTLYYITNYFYPKIFFKFTKLCCIDTNQN